MIITKTSRGFDYIKFIDYYGNTGELQKSSLADIDCIWLGTGEYRMHMTRDMVKELLPFLNTFVETGEIVGWTDPENDEPSSFDHEQW